jgi:hypothetical protein
LIPGAEWFAAGRVDRRKFDEYLLDPEHPDGRHKLRLWRSVFGVGEGEGRLLERLIREQIGRGIVTEKPPRTDLRRFEVLIEDFETAKNTEPMITAWVSEHGDWRRITPRFITAYPVVR